MDNRLKLPLRELEFRACAGDDSALILIPDTCSSILAISARSPNYDKIWLSICSTLTRIIAARGSRVTDTLNSLAGCGPIVWN